MIKTIDGELGGSFLVEKRWIEYGEIYIEKGEIGIEKSKLATDDVYVVRLSRVFV